MLSLPEVAMSTNHLSHVSIATRIIILLIALCVIPVSTPTAQELEKTDGVRTIYLIRHGDYDHDDESDPEIGKALIPLGVAQARILGARLRGMPVEFSSLHSSTMTRARETALVIGEEIPDLELQISPLIKECTPPTRREDIMAEETAEDLAKCVDQLEEAYPVFFTPSPDADRHDLIVCHGNVIRYFVTKVLEVDTTAWLGMSIGNCSLTVIKIKPDGSMKLLSFCDVGHLPPNLSTRTAPEAPANLDVPRNDAAVD